MPKMSPPRLLPVDFSPSPHDVICGRDNESIYHMGNVALRTVISEVLPAYRACESRTERGNIIADIVQRFQSSDPNRGFIRKDLLTGRWKEIGTPKAREKVGHLIRMAIYGRKSQFAATLTDDLPVDSAPPAPLGASQNTHHVDSFLTANAGGPNDVSPAGVSNFHHLKPAPGATNFPDEPMDLIVFPTGDLTIRILPIMGNKTILESIQEKKIAAQQQQHSQQESARLDSPLLDECNADDFWL